MNNIVIVNQGGMRYLFAAPIDVKLKKGNKVKCDTRRGVTDGTVWSDSLFADDETMQLIGKLTGAKFPLKSVVGKTVTSVEMFDKPQQEDKPKFKRNSKIRCVGETENGHKFTVGKVYEIDSFGRVKANDGFCFRRCSFDTAAEWLEDNGYAKFEPYTEPEQEPIKLYCVKDCGFWDKGKTYTIEPNGTIQLGGYTDHHKDFGELLRVHSQLKGKVFPLVKRPAKVGEYILIVSHPACTYDEYRKGDILQVVDYYKDGLSHRAAYYKNEACKYAKFSEYLVLDGYKPEPEYYNGEVVCVECDEFGYFTVGKIYKFVDGYVASNDKGEDKPFCSSQYKTLEEANDYYGVGAKFIPYKGKADADK